MSGRTTRRLRVLVIATEEPWPLNHGGRLRLFHLLNGLSRHTDVTLALPRPPEYRNRFPADITFAVAGNAATRAISAHMPPQRGRTFISRLARRYFGFRPALANWLWTNAVPQRFDAAFLSGAALGVYTECVRVPCLWDLADDPVLYTVREMEFSPPADWPASLGRAAFLALHVRDAAQHTAGAMFCSPTDASFARRWVDHRPVAVVRTCVDPSHFSPMPDVRPEPDTVAFVGTLDFPPNVDGITHFARTVWPELHAACRRRRLRVIGRNPVEPVRALATLPGVELVGEVADVRPHLAAAAIVVVPTRSGGGVKNKILEACAMGRPVIASPRALAGLTARVGVDVLCARRPAEWTTTITHLLADPPHADHIGAAGRSWVVRAHDWPTEAARLAELLARAAGPLPAATHATAPIPESCAPAITRSADARRILRRRPRQPMITRIPRAFAQAEVACR